MLRKGALALRHHVQALVAAGHSTQIKSFAAAAQGAKKQKLSTTKGAKQAVSGKEAREENATDKKFKLLLETLAPQDVKELELSAEQQAEYQRRAKQYSRRKMAEERAWQRDLTRKIKLKEAALAALPAKLRELADTADMTPFPLERMVPTHTPPIKGFSDRGRNWKAQQ